MVTRSIMHETKAIPSVVDMVVDWLRATSEVSSVTQGISSTQPVDDDDKSYPWLTVKRIVGITMTPEAALDRARMQFDAWGGVKPNGAPNWEPADILIRAVELEVRRTLQVKIEGKGALRGIQGLEGIQQLEDPDTGGARFWMDAIVVGVPE
ncbi:hypothetical protein LCGC14_1326780 [marine sediment metagenome]|uniref:Uncharacterized protein n=1 Tax=marine sediment metagenome TaxID=412755 RepID=A0A0F9KHX5_9ZZZZ